MSAAVPDTSALWQRPPAGRYKPAFGVHSVFMKKAPFILSVLANKNAPQPKLGTQKVQISNLRRFFHPDYTVGSGIAPDQLLSQVADSWLNAHHRRWGVTPAPKQTLYFVGIIHGISAFVNPFTKNGEVAKNRRRTDFFP